MKKINVSEATNTQLDWLVAQCEGVLDEDIYPRHSYTTDPDQMQPIMEREFISTSPGDWDVDSVPMVKNWCAWSLSAEIHNDQPFAYGPTQLIAAARAYIVSKLGEIVEVPEELT